MHTIFDSLSRLTNDALLAQVKRLVACECEATASLVAHLAEMDARRLHLEEGCSSLFAYCTRVLHLTENAAYGRIEAARAARRFPVLLDMLSRGNVNLTTITLLGPVLTPENHHSLLAEARHKSCREIEHIVARVRPQPSVAASVRRLPERVSRTASTPAGGMPVAGMPVAGNSIAASLPVGATTPQDAASESFAAVPAAASAVAPAFELQPPRPAVIEPLGPGRYRVQFTASEATHEKLRRAQDLLRHQVPNGDIATLFDKALEALLREVEKKRFGNGKTHRSNAKAGVNGANGAAGADGTGGAAGADGTGGAAGANSEAAASGMGAESNKAVASSTGAANSKAEASSTGAANSEAGASEAGASPKRNGRSRHIPAAVRQAVWKRDGERCTFVGQDGRRCNERRFLEFDHAHPHGDGGPATVENLRLRCRAHNQYTAELYYGPPEAPRVREAAGVYSIAGARESPGVCVRESSAEYAVAQRAFDRGWRVRGFGENRGRIADRLAFAIGRGPMPRGPR